MEDLDFTEEAGVAIQPEVKTRKTESRNNFKEVKDSKQLINCLRNEKITVKFIPRESGLVTDPKHVLYGGLGINSKIRYVVPRLQSGVYVNILTNSEKEYLEYIMGLEENALSVYKKVDNYWANQGVILGKGNSILDLSNPDDFIKYKILLANKDFIAPSEEEYNKQRKATYRYVISKEGSDYEIANNSLNTNARAYTLYGELKSDSEKLALVVELGTGKIVSSTNKEALFATVDKFIREYPLRFIQSAEDEYLDTKLLIKRAIERGFIKKRGTYYYMTEDNSPLCTEKQEPTLQSACQYLNSPKYQEKKFYLEGKIKIS